MEHGLNESEEKSLVGLLYNHVTFGTTLQVFNEAGEDNTRINTLRRTLEKLLIKYKLIDALSPDVLLLLGLSDRVAKEDLEAWSRDDKNKHIQLRAQYFLKKITQ